MIEAFQTETDELSVVFVKLFVFCKDAGIINLKQTDFPSLITILELAKLSKQTTSAGGDQEPSDQ